MISPSDFYLMEFTDYMLLKAGYQKSKIYERRFVRTCIAILLSPWAKDLSEFSLFKLPLDDELKKEIKESKMFISEESRERLRKIKEQSQN